MHYCASIQPKRESSKTYTDFTKLVIDNHAELDVNNLDVSHYNSNMKILIVNFEYYLLLIGTNDRENNILLRRSVKRKC